MNQDASFPPMLPPSTELGALLFAALPCLQETYRPLASFAYHMTELTRLKTIPSVPPLPGLSGIDALISDKDAMLHSLSFYGKLFRMPFLSTIANLLQALQFYHAYKDILPGLLSSLGAGGEDTSSPFGSMAGLFSGLSGLGSGSSDLFSALGGLSPDLLSSLFSGFSGNSASHHGSSQGRDNTASEPASPASEPPSAPSDIPYPEHAVSEITSPSDIPSKPDAHPDNFETKGTSVTTPDSDEAKSASAATPDSDAPAARSENTADPFDSLYAFLTPEQKKIYEQLMHTD